MNGRNKKVKIGIKLVAVVAALLAVIITISVTMVFATMSNVMKQTYVEDTVTSTKALENTVNNYYENASTYANMMATDKITVSSMVGGDLAKVHEKLKEFAIMSGATQSLILDDTGKIIITDDIKLKGKNLASVDVVAYALTGKTETSVEEISGMPYGIIGVAPIKDGTGVVRGAVLYLFSLVDNSILDNLKMANGSEFTIFKGATRANTTIFNDGVRAIGTDASAEIVDKVITKGERVQNEIQLFGKTHMCVYEPMRDANNNVVGMLFSGKDIQYILDTERNGLIISIAVALVLFILSGVVLLLLVKKMITEPLKNLVYAVNEIEQGELGISNPNYTPITASTNDEIGELSTQLGKTVDGLRQYISEIAYVLKEIVAGNLNVKTKGEYKGDFIEIRNSLGNITTDLKSIMGEIGIAGTQVSDGSNRVAQGAQELAAGADQQNSEIARLATFVTEITNQINNTAVTASKATAIANQAGTGVQQSNIQMGEMTSAMAEINNSSAEISKIIKTIDDIAFQTNILALNAAVEAARAGAAGKGFAVVADEVRNLAQKSAEAASQTTGLIENSIHAVRNGTQIANDTAKSLRGVVDDTKMVVEFINEIAAEAQNQAAGVTDINNSVAVISTVINQTSATAQESAAAAEELSGQAIMLHQKIVHFKIDD